MNTCCKSVKQGLVLTLVLGLCGFGELVSAQTGQEALPDAPSLIAQNTQPDSTEVPTPDERSSQTPSAPDGQQPRPSPPAGAAGAEEGKTAGGAASRPAGTAVAPARQRQVRSFLIKLGGIAAAGAAVGTVYALTRGTSSTPPGASR